MPRKSFCVCTVTFVLLCFVCSFVLFLVVWFCTLCSIFPQVPWLAKGGVPVTPEKQTLKNSPYPSFLSTPHPGTHPFSCLHENHPQTPEWDRRLKTFSC